MKKEKIYTLTDEDKEIILSRIFGEHGYSVLKPSKHEVDWYCGFFGPLYIVRVKIYPTQVFVDFYTKVVQKIEERELFGSKKHICELASKVLRIEKPANNLRLTYRDLNTGVFKEGVKATIVYDKGSCDFHFKYDNDSDNL